MTQRHTLTKLLRVAIADCGLPHAQIAREAGVVRGSLMRFARGDTSLRLDVADKLATYFKIEFSLSKRRGK